MNAMNTWEIKVLFDGACPLCRREADVWRMLDKRRGRIALEDISAPDFDPGRYGLTRRDVAEQIHGVLPSGAIVTGMDVFRYAYRAVGFGWLTAPTGWPILRPVFDRAYHWFARNRLRLTRRVDECGDACAPREKTEVERKADLWVGGGI